MLRIFIALKKTLLSSGFEPVNLGCNGKHGNHYTIEDDSLTLKERALNESV
jgi:hypothetical protein